MSNDEDYKQSFGYKLLVGVGSLLLSAWIAGMLWDSAIAGVVSGFWPGVPHPTYWQWVALILFRRVIK